MLLRGGRLGPGAPAVAGVDEVEGDGDWLVLFPHDEGVEVVSSGAGTDGAMVVADSILIDSIFTGSMTAGAVLCSAVRCCAIDDNERVAGFGQAMVRVWRRGKVGD